MTYRLLTIALLAGALAVFIPDVPPPIVADARPADWRAAWAVDLLARLGNTAPTPETVAFIVQWTRAEDSSDGAFNRNNALNTTICGFHMTGAINTDGACGVQGYATYDDGLDATAATLAGAAYADLVQALVTNDPDAARAALWASPWAESRYGNGAAWPKE